MTTVLITAIGGDIAQGLATILREAYPQFRLVGMDIHERHGGQLSVDALHKAPPVADPNYLAWLSDLMRREKVNHCIPTSEAELVFLARQGLAAVADVPLVMPNAKSVLVGCDKLSTAQFLTSIGCPGPWTLAAADADATVPLPCVFKPRCSAGSKSVFICKTFAEIAFYRERHPNSVVQELLLPAEQEVTCAIYRTKDGRTAVLQLLRTLVGGFTGWARVIDNPEVSKQCVQIAEALDLSGGINAQLRLTDRGPRIFEINPRFSSTLLLRHKMGFRDGLWSMQEALGEKVSFYHPPVGTTGVRVQDAAVLGNGKQGSCA
ncbi:MAG: ATP-grasp domain-containing protein [Planctomycetes bacterium]|nr:ATP-grasp domain-containing protein [Planctomycetota bacterium]